MTNRKSTKRALLGSIMAMVLCLALLVGATFAWFTDTASTGVNKIQAGKLDVALEMKDAAGQWVSAEGKTLDFVKAAAGERLGDLIQARDRRGQPERRRLKPAGAAPRSAAQAVAEDTGVPVIAIAGLSDLLAFVGESADLLDQRERLQAYRGRYGCRTFNHDAPTGG